MADATGGQPVPLEVGTVDIVLAALADMRHGRRQVEAIAAAAEIVDVVVFEVEF